MYILSTLVCMYPYYLLNFMPAKCTACTVNNYNTICKDIQLVILLSVFFCVKVCSLIVSVKFLYSNSEQCYTDIPYTR